ncbi:MAG: substrate-binding domain-containing protein [Chloroflexi bacterium]|nr:substrate-binding domain-containing protein [Chloroflexota bacterium]MYJ92125.1 substrate-binding domain-containing protein [Chloroflexota bacterium]
MSGGWKMINDHRHTLVGLVVGLIIGASATGLIWATSGSTAEVRVVARKLDDGRVEVALQTRPVDPQAQLEGLDSPGWGDRLSPEFRFLAGDATVNRWYASSVVTIESEEPAPPSVAEIGPFEISGTPTVSRPFDRDTLFCVLTHGVQEDFFWFQVYSALLDARRWNDINLRAEMYTKGVDQADGIRRCVEDGAAAIATTLAEPDVLLPALQEASEAGVRVVTFNSGAERATDVGSIAHVSIDEAAVGRTAAEQFRQREVSGDLLCIIHEPSNTGLEERCDSLEISYDGGSVIRVRISDADDSSATITAHATDDVGGAIALNSNTAYLMAEALSAARPDIVLAAVSAEFPTPLAMLYSGRLSFVLWSHALEQGYLTTTTLLWGHGTPFPVQTGLFAEATQISILPTVVTAEAVQAMFDADSAIRGTLPAWIDALERAIRDESAQSGE